MRITAITAAAIFIGCACIPVVVSANPEVERISLDQVRAYALLHSVESRKIDRDIGLKLAEIIEIKRIALPTLGIGMDVPIAYTDQRPENEFKIELQQPVRMSDFGLRSALGELMEITSALEKQRMLQSFIQRISLSYYRLWALRQEKTHVHDQHSAAVRVLKLISDAASQGMSSAAEVKIASANRAKLKADVVGIDHEIRKAEGALTRLAAVDLKGRRLKRPVLIELRSFDEMLRSARENRYSLGERTRLHFQLADEQLRLARRESYPTLVPKLSYARNEEGVDFIGFGLSFDLPLYDRNKGQVLRKERERAYARREHRYVNGDEFEVEFRSFFDQVQSKVEQADIYEKEVLPPLAESVKLSEEAVASSQIPLLQLWAVQNRYHEAIDRSTELWIEAYSGLTELSLITGELEL